MEEKTCLACGCAMDPDKYGMTCSADCAEDLREQERYKDTDPRFPEPKGFKAFSSRDKSVYISYVKSDNASFESILDWMFNRVSFYEEYYRLDGRNFRTFQAGDIELSVSKSGWITFEVSSAPGECAWNVVYDTIRRFLASGFSAKIDTRNRIKGEREVDVLYREEKRHRADAMLADKGIVFDWKTGEIKRAA